MNVPAAKISFPEEDRKEILQNIDEILQTARLTLGNCGKEFEEKFANYIEAKYAIAVNSGTSALEIILSGRLFSDSPTNTLFITAAAVIHAGAKVIFAGGKLSFFQIISKE